MGNSCVPSPSLLRLFGIKKKQPVEVEVEQKNPAIDFRRIQVTLAQLEETSTMKHQKAMTYRRKAIECRKNGDEKGAALHIGYCCVLQDQALQVDTLKIKLDGLFEVVQQLSISHKGVDHMRDCIVFIKQNAESIDIDGAEKVADELAEAIDQAGEITAAVARDPFAGAPPVSNRDMRRMLDELTEPADEEMEAPVPVPVPAKKLPGKKSRPSVPAPGPDELEPIMF